jgi:4-hydroxy-tetrahydrodipicolinate reductase
VVVLCTSSSLKKVLPQIEGVLALKVPIVSTTRSWPTPNSRRSASLRASTPPPGRRRLRYSAPASTPDSPWTLLPITLTGVCESVTSMHGQSHPGCADRADCRSSRRSAAVDTAQFQSRVDDGSVRHVGLTESIAMIADAMGWKR